MHGWLCFLFAVAAVTADPKPKFNWACETLLAPVPRDGVEVAATLIKLPSGSEVFTRIEKPRGLAEPRRWVFAVHGLLESHRTFDEMTARLIPLGYGVARLDLRGFARSLHDRHHIKGVLDYRESVRDLHELLTVLRLRYHVTQPRIVGHSKGAALELALLAQPGVAELVDDRHVIINPYVYRNEAYLAKKMHLSSWTAFEAWMPPLTKILPQMVADTYLVPQMERIFLNYLRGARHVRDLDLSQYRVRQALDEQVEVAVAITRGLRGLNSLNELGRISPSIKVDMIYGDRDATVEPQLARELARPILARGGRALEVHSGHDIPNSNLDELLSLVLDEGDVDSARARAN